MTYPACKCESQGQTQVVQLQVCTLNFSHTTLTALAGWSLLGACVESRCMYVKTETQSTTEIRVSTHSCKITKSSNCIYFRSVPFNKTTTICDHLHFKTSKIKNWGSYKSYILYSEDLSSGNPDAEGNSLHHTTFPWACCTSLSDLQFVPLKEYIQMPEKRTLGWEI